MSNNRLWLRQPLGFLPAPRQRPLQLWQTHRLCFCLKESHKLLGDPYVMAFCFDPAGQPQETAAVSECRHQQAPQGPRLPSAPSAPASAPAPPPGSPRARGPRQTPASQPCSPAGPGTSSATDSMDAAQVQARTLLLANICPWTGCMTSRCPSEPLEWLSGQST